jgi:PAS domain-containing protein
VAAFSYDLVLTTASLLSVMLLTCAGFAIAGSGAGWRPAMGGAVNGTGLGLMQYLGLSAVVVPGAIVWDVPLVVASLGLGIGLNAAALTALHRLRGHAALWSAAALLTLALVVLHLFATHAAHVVAAPGLAGPAHHWLLAAVAVGAAAVVLGLGCASMVIDRKSTRANLRTLQELVDKGIEGLVLVREGRVTRLNRRIAELGRFQPGDLIGKGIEAILGDQVGAVGSVRESLLRTAWGRRVPVKVVHERLSSGEDVYVIQDLTERRSAEAELQRRNKILQAHEDELRSRNLLLDTALKHMSQGLCMYDKEQRVVVCNERYAALYGLSADDVKPGTTRREIVEKRIARGLWAGVSPEAYLHERTSSVDAASYSVQEMNDGRSIAAAHVPMPGGGWVCTHEDITERRGSSTWPATML